MFNATTTTPYTSTHCMYNVTNTSQVVCVIDSKNQTQYLNDVLGYQRA